MLLNIIFYSIQLSMLVKKKVFNCLITDDMYFDLGKLQTFHGKNLDWRDQRKRSAEASADWCDNHVSGWVVLSHCLSNVVITVPEIIQSLFLWSVSKKCSERGGGGVKYTRKYPSSYYSIIASIKVEKYLGYLPSYISFGDDMYKIWSYMYTFRFHKLHSWEMPMLHGKSVTSLLLAIC